MAKLEFIDKDTKSKIEIDSQKLIGKSTKSLYIRKGFINETLFLSQKGNGSWGSGDICKLDQDATIEVGANLFGRLKVYFDKASEI
jgi:hypothetical protein